MRNAFRARGSPSIEALREQSTNVAYFKGRSETMHRGIIAHEYHIDASTVDELSEMRPGARTMSRWGVADARGLASGTARSIRYCVVKHPNLESRIRRSRQRVVRNSAQIIDSAQLSITHGAYIYRAISRKLRRNELWSSQSSFEIIRIMPARCRPASCQTARDHHLARAISGDTPQQLIGKTGWIF